MHTLHVLRLLIGPRESMTAHLTLVPRLAQPVSFEHMALQCQLRRTGFVAFGAFSVGAFGSVRVKLRVVLVQCAHIREGDGAQLALDGGG